MDYDVVIVTSDYTQFQVIMLAFDYSENFRQLKENNLKSKEKKIGEYDREMWFEYFCEKC